MSELHDTKDKNGIAVTHELNASSSHNDAIHRDDPAYDVIDPAAERKLVFKLDVSEAARRSADSWQILILPLTALLYLSAFLDRSNMGNAKL